MIHAVSLYDQIIEVTDAYLGPASERFVSRQVTNHLHKEPVQLKHADLPGLIQWIKVTISVLTEDSRLVNDYIKELEGLAAKRSKRL